MSQLGGPGSRQANAKPIPLTYGDLDLSRPQRGSFPLDHDGELRNVCPNPPNIEVLGLLIRNRSGECKHVIATYLECIKKVRGVNDSECRDLAKSYLACRMDRNLMAKDEFKNLGFDNGPKPANDPNGLTLGHGQAKGSGNKDKDAKPGELRW
ncbi:CHCH domain-containing protein [Colletotrichum salicis]|uniref:CHCH domain-containing protein n=1 Tax=Colletotrichum salicis TaxID=1209931 RepID=A0A135U7W8_9PEZI|nr:CHCH domain-containing protein [Colletotrichum salicis]